MPINWKPFKREEHGLKKTESTEKQTGAYEDARTTIVPPIEGAVEINEDYATAVAQARKTMTALPALGNDAEEQRRMARETMPYVFPINPNEKKEEESK